MVRGCPGNPGATRLAEQGGSTELLTNQVTHTHPWTAISVRTLRDYCFTLPRLPQLTPINYN